MRRQLDLKELYKWDAIDLSVAIAVKSNVRQKLLRMGKN
jgi:hypothetical protein